MANRPTVGSGRGANAIRIDGLTQLQKKMKELPPQVRKDFNREMRAIAGEVVGEVRNAMDASYAATEAETGRKSRSTGEAQASVKPSLQGGYVSIRAGGSSAPYYPWLDFGGDRRKRSSWTTSGRVGKQEEHQRPFYREGRWIYPTIARIRPRIYAKAMAAVEKAKGIAGL
jgi:hypothetical protein